MVSIHAHATPTLCVLGFWVLGLGFPRLAAPQNCLAGNGGMKQKIEASIGPKTVKGFRLRM